MLTFLGQRRRFCDGINRRNFLKIGAFGAGLTLADMFRGRALAGTQAASSNKAAIMIFLPGGPSHTDMYDLKPDAPAEYRGEFRPIKTNVPGIHICEHFPLQARMWDKLACIRSVVAIGEHADAQIMTGYSEEENKTAHHPSFGSVVSRLRAGRNAEVPAFVSLRGMALGCEPGYLGVAHRAFTPNGPALENLRMANGVSTQNLADRRNLLAQFDNVRRDIDATGTMAGLDTFEQRAFDMIASGSVRRALDLSREEPRIRERYRGVEQFLQARRLVEAGVGCVTLAIGSWDTHDNNFETMRRQMPMVDRGVANLVQDLVERGMDQDVVTIMWGEFGRTPRISGNAGRDHWPAVMSALIAGGGLRMGQMVGATTPRGEQPKDRRCTVQQVLATVYRGVGIDPATTFLDGAGRPRYLLDDRQPLAELL